MSNLVPVEVITDILQQLPVKTLLRFRCVSKPWCSLIDSPYFIKLHLNHSLKTNTNQSLSSDKDLFSVEFDTLDTAIKLNNPIEYASYTTLLGSCNGLVALLRSYEDVALWNPSTRKYHKLPATPFETEAYFIKYWFGYDAVSDDYKLVRMEQSGYGVEECQVKIYSLMSNSWRRTRDFPYYLVIQPRNGILANNALHWVVSGTPDMMPDHLIVAFDLGIEEYFEVPLPDYMEIRCFMCVGSLGGCLCVFYYGNSGDDHMWVMKEYGVKESWIKLFSKEYVMGQRDLIERPLAYSKSGDRVLLDHNNNGIDFAWYDLRRKRFEEVIIQGGRSGII